MEEVRIPEQLSNFNLVQPTEEGILLATSRCEYSRPPNPNGKFFGEDGACLGEMVLGDGVQDMQTTKAGGIWASYFDEGIFGNLGWTNPIGSHGLLRFDRCGQRKFEFHPTRGLHPIFDCYALNVVNDQEAWCCYYTEFPLVQIVDDQIVGVWDCPIQGSSVFAVFGDLVLMQGAYDRFREWTIMTLLSGGQMRTEWTGLFHIDDETGAPLSSPWRASRGSSVWILQDGTIYHLDLCDLR